MRYGGSPPQISFNIPSQTKFLSYDGNINFRISQTRKIQLNNKSSNNQFDTIQTTSIYTS